MTTINLTKMSIQKLQNKCLYTNSKAKSWRNGAVGASHASVGIVGTCHVSMRT